MTVGSIPSSKSTPQSAKDSLAVHFLLAPGSEALKHRGRGVGQQAERQFVFRAETGVGLCGILADPDDIIPSLSQRRIVVSETAGLGRAAGSIVLGIEINNGLAAVADQVLRPYHVAVLVHDLESRHPVSYFQHNVWIVIYKYSLYKPSFFL